MNYLNYEILLQKKLDILKEKFNLYGVKAEFEAEGSSFRDITFLKKITMASKTKLFVKIGGVEAVNDIYNCINIGVDGIIAPMVETKFALSKFIDSIKKLTLKKKPLLSVNIESETGYKNLNEILRLAKGQIDNITIGRSDFSNSFFKKDINQNSDFITKKIIIIAKEAKKRGIETTVGGGINRGTIINFNKEYQIKRLIKKIETRKIMLPTNIFLKRKGALEASLDFEKNYILSKKQKIDLMMKSELNRLSILNNRE